MRNKPNSRMPAVPPPHISAKRTQFTVLPTSRQLGPQPKFCETNPIYRTAGVSPASPPPNFTKRTQFHPRGTPNTQNELNLPHRHHHHDPKCETNPIYPIATIITTQNAKRTQFAHTTTLHPTKNAKRTQSQPSLSSRAAGCGAKRSGPKPRDPLNQHRRRRFRTKKAHPHPDSAKRTQFATQAPNLRTTNYELFMRNEPNLNKSQQPA